MPDRPYERWLWRALGRVLSLSGHPDLAVVWGEGRAPAASAVVRVPRREDFRANIAALRQAASREPGDGLVARREAGTVVVDLDVDVLNWFGWFLSRTEECGSDRVDAYGRFPQEAALAEQLALSEVPVADHLACHLREALRLAARTAGLDLQTMSPWPEGKRFCVCLTHDVDTAVMQSLAWGMEKLIAAGVGALQRRWPTVRRRLSEAVGLALGGERNPYWIFDRMAEMEAQHGFRSAFYLLAQSTALHWEGGRPAWRYRLSQPEILAAFRRLARQGWEVGLHLGYDTAARCDGVQAEWRRLARLLGDDVTPRGGRCHFLRLRVPEGWRWMARAGMAYDASLGWSRGWGFRTGTSWPYRPFDRDRGEVIPIWEFGVHLMDKALPDARCALEGAAALLDRVAAVGGCAVLLFHPCPPPWATTQEYLAFYRDLLGLIADADGAWVVPPAECVRHLEIAAAAEADAAGGRSCR